MSGNGLEGSRFVGWQVCKVVAGGSRELPSGGNVPVVSADLAHCKDDRVSASGVVSGSRLLQTDRAATLLSGSPPAGKGLGILSGPAALYSLIELGGDAGEGGLGVGGGGDGTADHEIIGA